MSEFFDMSYFRQLEQAAKDHLAARRRMMIESPTSVVFDQLKRFGVCTCHCHFVTEPTNDCTFCVCPHLRDDRTFL